MVSGSSSGTVSGSVSLSSSGLVASWSGTLPANETITVYLGSGITDTSGNALTAYSYTFATVPDPLYSYQWHLVGSGQTAFASTTGTAGYTLGFTGTYTGYTGSGVTVAVLDSGLEITHEDLAANVVSSGSWDFANSDTDPTSTSTTGDHGTSVAGVIAAVGNNAKGGVGVARSASLKGYNVLAGSQTTADYVTALGGSTSSPNSSDIYVFNQSYGSSPAAATTINTTIEAQFTAGITNLRSGKGAIYVKSAGNGFVSYTNGTCTYAVTYDLTCHNANMDPFNTLPANIVIGATDASGVKASYSSAGSAIWISAPGGEYGGNSNVLGTSYSAKIYEPAIITTDQAGCTNGYSPNTYYNSFQISTHALNTSCNYTSTFNGTSSAAPMVSGVVALMLEANAALTWRDVKHILASTATQINTSHSGTYVGSYQAELGWITNNAGYKFHNYYGFGLVNADAAITSAKSYTSALGTYTNGGWTSSGTISTSIPDVSSTGASSTISYSTALTIEAVQISVDITHTYTGDIAIEITSPSGTKSILLNILNGFGTSNNMTDMVLASNAFYGETSTGNWTIKIIDGYTGDTGTLNSWQIRIYGH